MTYRITTSNLSLYSLYCAEECNEFTGPISASLRPRNTAPLEEMLLQWRAVGNTVSDLTGPRYKPQTSRSRDEHVTYRTNFNFVDGTLMPGCSGRSFINLRKICKYKSRGNEQLKKLPTYISLFSQNSEHIFHLRERGRFKKARELNDLYCIMQCFSVVNNFSSSSCKLSVNSIYIKF